jgi:hypothetical protein
MITEQFRINQRKKRKRIIIFFVIGLSLIIAVPFLMNFLMIIYSTQEFKAPEAISIIKKEIERPTVNHGIDLFIIRSNEYYYSFQKDNKKQRTKINRFDIEKIIKNNPQGIFFIKTCKTTQFSDVALILDIFSKTKTKMYAIVELTDKEIKEIDKLKQMNNLE